MVKRSIVLLVALLCGVVGMRAQYDAQIGKRIMENFRRGIHQSQNRFQEEKHTQSHQHIHRHQQRQEGG